MTLDISQPSIDCLADRGYDVRYGARPLKRTLARDVLNPLSRLVLDGSVIDGDIVRVRTRGEAEKILKNDSKEIGFISASGSENEKNTVVIMKNHNNEKDTVSDMWEDDDLLADDVKH